MSQPWQAKEKLVTDTLVDGRSLIFVGGRGTGTTTLVRAIEERLSKTSVEVSALYLYEGSPLLTDVEAFVAGLTGMSEPTGVPPVPRVGEAIRTRLREHERSGAVVLVDGLHLLGRQPWGVDLVDFLRAIISECSHITVGLFGRPSLDLLFDGASSPLSNVCARITASTADPQRVRDHFAAEGTSAGHAMRGYRLVGGLPVLVADAVQAIRDGQPEAEVAAQVALTRGDWLDAQYHDLDPLAREALVALHNDSLTIDGLRARLGPVSIDTVLAGLSAHLLISVDGGQVTLESAVHKAWLTTKVALRRTAARVALSSSDREAYRIVSELEWRCRGWIGQRLSQASPEDWWEERIPEDPRRRAETRRDAEQASGVVSASAELIDYLDFSDIREVIRYTPNWSQLFKNVLVDWRATMEISMSRIEATRRKVAHSRPLAEGELGALEQDARLIIELLER